VRRYTAMENGWLQTLGKMTYGIYLLTTYNKEKINGMVASWVSQVSYDPFMVMVAIHPNRYSHHLIEQSGYFALHVLAKNQADLLERFKGPDPAAKFASIHWVRGREGCPILESCIAYMECQVRGNYRPGNHTLFIGEVKDAQVFSEEEPLKTSDYEGIYLGKA
jgi:flavin reductase (DIM6/NTAB) family NADH-FMN oxidoreductase RutF